jgi:flagellar biosynthesis protein FlhF
MALVRADLGLEALILSTRRVSQGVEVTAALEPDDAEQHTQDRAALAAIADPPPPSRAPPTSATDLAYHGVPATLAARLAGPDLPGALRAALRFGVLPLLRDGPPLLLAGMPGAGKTLTIARLATRLVLDGIKPLVITADGRRAGAAEELAAYTRLLGVGLVVASTPATLARALAQRQADSPVLIDTPGINPFAEAELADLQALAGVAKATCVLVMPAGQDVAEASEQAQAFLPLGIRHLLPTRLDLTRRLGSLLGVAATADLILTEAGIGTGATDGLSPLTPEFLAERLGHMPAPARFPAPWVPGRPVAAASRQAAREPAERATVRTSTERQTARHATDWIRG